MEEFELSNFNKIIKEIIKKSLFTERQIKIILNLKNITETKFSITKGAYYRQVGQSKNKLLRVYYTILLLRGLGILLPDDIDVMLDLSEKLSVINNSDIFPEKEEQIIDVIDMAVHRACNL